MMSCKSLTRLMASPLLLTAALSTQAETFDGALNNVKVSADFRLRYESVMQDNTLKDAHALTLRSRLGYKTESYKHFSGLIEFEDSRVVAGIDNYNDGLGSKPEYSVIADPETTELSQAYIRYHHDKLTAKVGRQVMTLNNHRFLGHVGWRQNRQTFDGLSLDHKTSDKLSFSYRFIGKRNRVLAEEKDIASNDHLLQLGYMLPIGHLTNYVYRFDEQTEENKVYDNYGLRFHGGLPISSLQLLYTAEYAIQTKRSAIEQDYLADYLNLEAGISYNGHSLKLGHEILGSDNGNYGFSTPLATLHKFNGWADQFLATPKEGLIDTSISFSSKLAIGKFDVILHNYTAAQASDTVKDLGSEINLAYTRSFATNFYAGITYAGYSAGDIKVDTNKVWLWTGMKF